MVAALQSGAQKGPHLDNMDKLFAGLVHGVMAYPLNFPGTAHHHALQCRKKLVSIFLGELEKKKKQNGVEMNDLMDGLMQIRDEEDNKLSDQEVLDNIVSLVIAGYESTSLASIFEPGPHLDNMDKLFAGLVHGVMAYPLNFPGTAHHHALQCRKKLVSIFLGELEKKKKQNGVEMNDLMDGLMQIRDEEDNKLSDQEVLDNIVSLVIAGYESTSLASM
nr:cytochrome p450 85a [Quercus suber]